MIIVSSKNGQFALEQGMKLLKEGATAVDAVEAATRLVERNSNDQTVGLGGLPNLLGEVRLDACIMDGHTLQAGAVGAVRNHIHVITLARKVMEETPHVFLVGDGAERFAAEVGLKAENPLTQAAANRWRETLNRRFPHLDSDYLPDDQPLRSMVEELNKPMEGWQLEEPHGTVNFIARDGKGHFASAVSTSGWPWCYPGRLGDSPVPGGGNYADSRWGAAASTGTGEVVLRTSAARSIILYMKMGMAVDAAVREALADLKDLQDPYVDHIALIALDRQDRHAGYAFRPDARYAFLRHDMASAEETEMPPP